ncbi:MAG: glycosyltransferase family 9 protein [Bacteroidota bacterium]
MVRFLIIRFSSIGDIVLTTPVVRCLKQQVEGAEVHYVTKKQFKGILEPNPYVDKVITLDDGLKSLIRVLKDQPYDYIIDLHHNIRTTIIKNRLKRMSFTFNKINLPKWLMVNFKLNRLPDMHIVDRYMNTLRLFDVENDTQGLDYFIPPSEEIELNTLPVTHQKGYIGWVIGAKHNTKKYPVEHVVEIIKTLNKPVILLGGPDDNAEAGMIVSQTGPLVYNGCGKYSLNGSASLVRQARVIVSNDTGLMHIASAFKKPIVSLWGNTIPEFGMYPYLPGEGSHIAEVKGLSCRPCSKIGYQKCPKKHFKCMHDIDRERIIEIISGFI